MGKEKKKRSQPEMSVDRSPIKRKKFGNYVDFVILNNDVIRGRVVLCWCTRMDKDEGPFMKWIAESLEDTTSDISKKTNITAVLRRRILDDNEHKNMVLDRSPDFSFPWDLFVSCVEEDGEYTNLTSTIAKEFSNYTRDNPNKVRNVLMEFHCVSCIEILHHVSYSCLIFISIKCQSLLKFGV